MNRRFAGYTNSISTDDAPIFLLTNLRCFLLFPPYRSRRARPASNGNMTRSKASLSRHYAHNTQEEHYVNRRKNRGHLDDTFS